MSKLFYNPIMLVSKATQIVNKNFN